MADTKTRQILFENGNEAKVAFAQANTATDILIKELRLSLPKVLIIVIGGAGNLDQKLKNRLSQLYRSIAKTAAASEALIIDGGTQAGVMAMMGEAVATNGHKTPLVGVSPAGKVSYPGNISLDGTPLEPNHTHFVLVEGHEWGNETPTLFDLVRHLTRNTSANGADAAHIEQTNNTGNASIPVLAVLSGGGNIAKQEVLRVVRQNIPLLVVEGSGGYADEISAAYEQKDQVLNDPILGEVIADGKLYFHFVDDAVQKFERCVVQALGIEKVLTQAWEIYAGYDLNATQQQKRFNTQQFIILGLGVTGAALVAAQQVFAPRDEQHHLLPPASLLNGNLPWWLVHYTLVLIPVLLTLCLSAASYFKQGRRWLFLRAGAEAIKREIYRYRMLKVFYLQDAEKQLAKKMDDITRRTMQTEANLSALSPYDKIKGFPPANFAEEKSDDGFSALTPDEYVAVRLQEQINYYFGKTVKLDKKQKRIYWTTLLCGAAGTFLAAIGQQVWVALMTTVIAALSTYLGYRQTEFLLVKYNQTGTALANIKAWWHALTTVEQSDRSNIELLVDHTEQVLQVEQDSWIQQMQNALAKLKNDQDKAVVKEQKKNSEDETEAG